MNLKFRIVNRHLHDDCRDFLEWDLLVDLTGDSVVKTPCSQSKGTGLIPGQRTKIQHAIQCGQKIKINVKWDFFSLPIHIFKNKEIHAIK